MVSNSERAHGVAPWASDVAKLVLISFDTEELYAPEVAGDAFLRSFFLVGTQHLKRGRE
jgi:hypothetical protein